MWQSAPRCTNPYVNPKTPLPGGLSTGVPSGRFPVDAPYRPVTAFSRGQTLSAPEPPRFRRWDTGDGMFLAANTLGSKGDVRVWSTSSWGECSRFAEGTSEYWPCNVAWAPSGYRMGFHAPGAAEPESGLDREFPGIGFFIAHEHTSHLRRDHEGIVILDFTAPVSTPALARPADDHTLAGP
jgi:hypothetical protein